MTPAKGNMINALNGRTISLVAPKKDWADSNLTARARSQAGSGEPLTRLRRRTAKIARQEFIHASSRAIPSDSAVAAAPEVRGFVTELQKNRSPSANGTLPAQWQIHNSAGIRRNQWTVCSSSRIGFPPCPNPEGAETPINDCAMRIARYRSEEHTSELQ